jgi:hypothetical protein
VDEEVSGEYEDLQREQDAEDALHHQQQDAADEGDVQTGAEMDVDE